MDEWQRDNPDEDVAEAGHLVQIIPLPARGLTKCVMLRTGKGYDVDLEASQMAQIKEVMEGDGRSFPNTRCVNN